MSEAHRSNVPIAVIGVSALFPGSSDARGFWADILAGRDLVTDVPASHWLIDDYYDPNPAAPDKTYCKRGAFLSPVDFDPMEFGVPPSIVPATDSAQILALIVAQKVLEDASDGQFASMDRERMSIVLGVTSGQELLGTMVSRLQRPNWLKGLREAGIPEAEAQAACDRIAAQYVPWQESSFPGLLGNVVAGRIANRFDLRGTNCVTDAACASSLSALSLGVNELSLGQSDVVIVGGVDTMNDIFMYMCFSKTPALSPTGDCRPFSDAADGTLLGEGLAMLALKRLSDAERDGDRVYAVIRGVGSASDGRSKSVYAPLPEGQARALRRAYEVAGYGADTVELVEAHGTGTKAGDAAEFEGLRIAFDESGKKERQWCALGSVKSQIGHTKATAGAAGLFKAVMALSHKVLPPTIKVERPNPNLHLSESPFYLNTKARPWIRDASHPRRASVSSFGFGGSNFHVALEEYVPAAGSSARQAWRLRATPTELVLLGAASATELAASCRKLAGAVGDLAHAARASQEAFVATSGARLAVVASSAADLSAKLEQAAATIEKSPGSPFSTPTGVHYATGAAQAGGVALLFPGQGSQYVGMGADVAMAFDAARSAWDDAAALRFDGAALQDVVFPIPGFDDATREAQEQKLTATEWAQPALGVASAALLRVLSAVGLSPACVGGHSFGEVTALHAAGAISAGDLVRIARRRGELMRDAAAVPGAMIAVSRPLADVEAWLRSSAADVVMANHNGPAQVVLSGATDAVTKAEKALVAEGFGVKRLPVATAFHSPLVAPSSAPLLDYLRGLDVAAPTVDVYGNTDAAPYPADPAAIRERLASQLSHAVRFVDEIEAMYARGVRTFVEVGAGSVLTELVGRILGERPHLAVGLDRKGRNGVTSLQEGLGRLALGGVELKLGALWAPFAPAPTKPARKPAMALPIGGNNYGKPYPPAGGTKALPPPNPPRAAVVVAAAAAPPPQLAPAPVMPRPANPGASLLAHSAPPAAAPVAAAASSEVHMAWVQAYQDSQRQTADAHSAYQRAMAESHMAFLRTTEASFAGLSAMLTGQPTGHALPAPAPTAQPAPWHVEPMQSTASPPAPPLVDRVSHAAPAVVAAAPAPVAAAAPSVDLEALMLAIVAEKTGYPAEMLGSHMELEADLGIDSIKRVEILSAMRERAPGLGEVKPAELAKLRTLGQIVEHLRALGGAAASPAAAATPAPAASSIDLEALMLAIVAEKTGYPAEMLGAHMELEADLGIDSIKRVEILSAMRERAPGLGEVKPAELAKLRTLGQIVEHLRSLGGAAASPAAAAAPAPAASSIDLEALMLAIVAEKTGYPAEMLGAHMELEADLGIDSIKRVEILSAMRERAPGLGEVKPAELAKLRTLGQIVEHLRGLGGGAPNAGAASPATASPANGAAVAPPGNDIRRFAVRESASAAVGLALGGLSTVRRLVVTDDGRGVARALASLLASRGVAAEVASEIPADADGVVFLGGLRAVADADEAVAVNREAFRAAKAAAARIGGDGGVFVTVQDTGGDFGLSGREATRAWLGGVAALARTVAREWPRASVKAIDCEGGGRAPEAVAAALADELLGGGSTLDVGLHADGSRTTLAAVPAAASASGSPALSEGDVVLASGGARGVTAAALVALARAHRPRIVLLGRTALADESPACASAKDEAALKRALLAEAQAAGQKVVPAEIGAAVARVLAVREVRATLDALQRAGSEARYLAVDVQDGDALRAALEDVRRTWGPVTGIVHGAGVLSDKLVAEKTEAQFDRVFDTKVAGLRALLAATAGDPLRLLCLFSSVAARTGNVGQSDYAMANEILNQVACAEAARRGPTCRVCSIGWGPWEGGMVTPSLGKHFRERGVALIPLETGGRMLVEELDGAGPDVETVIGGDAGGESLGYGAEPSVRLDVHVDAVSHPYLADHRIAGTAVVPVVLAAEWLARAALACRPDLACVSLRDLRVLRGIKLDRFDAGGQWLQARCKQSSNGQGAMLGAELRGPNEALHYSATVQMSERPGAALAPVPRTDGLASVADASPYDGRVLFHGPRFQVLRRLGAVSDAGVVAEVARTTEMGWGAAGFVTDPAALDGGLQLALLWAGHVLGGAALPMSVAEIRLHTGARPSGPLYAVVSRRDVREARCVCDVSFVDEQGALLAEMLGVETVLRPGEARGAVHDASPGA